MIDIRLLREKPDEVRAAYERLGATVDLDGVIAADARVRDLKNESQTLQAEQNRLSKEIGRAAAGEAREQAKADSTALKEKIEKLDGELAAAEADARRAAARAAQPAAPVGAGRQGRDARTGVLREEGTKRGYDFAPKPHWDLGTALGIIDFERGVKISGSRFYVLKGWGARLQRALITLMLDLHTQKHGYVEIYPPYMVRRECLVGTGNLPKFGDNLYRDAEEDFWFIPTAEVPVTNLYRDEILDGARLPIKHVAFTACFRREQMAAGRDTRGIKRGHQFDKVELVKFVRPETSMDELTGLLVRRRGRPARRWSCPTAWCRCAPATCRSRRWPSSTSSSGRPAATSGWRSAPAPTSATSRPAARASASRTQAQRRKRASSTP